MSSKTNPNNPNYDPPSRIVSRLASPSTTTSTSSQSSTSLTTSQTNLTTTNGPQSSASKSREDSIALLSGLTENSQLAPAIKAIYDRGWTGTFQGFLERAIQQKDQEILLTCNEHFEELIYTIDHVLAAKEQAVGLKNEIVQLHRDLQDTSRNLLNHSVGLNDQRIIHQNLMITIHVLEQINTDVFALLSQAFQQTEEKRYFIALKTLAHVQNQLQRYQSFHFAKQLEIQIPILAGLIKNIVRQEFELWLLGLKDKGPILGYFTLHSVHVKLYDIHRKYHLRIQERLKSIGLDLNPCALLKYGNFATSLKSTAKRRDRDRDRDRDNTGVNEISPVSNNNNNNANTLPNFYVLLELNFGCKTNIFDPFSPRQPYNVLLHTRPASINKAVVDRAQQMKSIAKQYTNNTSSSSSSSTQRTGSAASNSDENRPASRSRRNKKDKKVNKTTTAFGTTIIDHSSDEEYLDGDDSDEYGFGIKVKNNKKIKKRRKRITTTTTIRKIYKDGKWIEVNDTESDSDSDDYSDDDDEYADAISKVPELKNTNNKTTTTTTTADGKKITTVTTTTTSGSNTTTTKTNSSSNNNNESNYKDRRMNRFNAAIASQQTTLNSFRKQADNKIDLYDSLDKLDDSNEIDVSNELTMFTLTAMSAANISFIPLYQCLHVYQSLGQLSSFRLLYSNLRHTQATTQVKVLADNTSFNASGYYNPSSTASQVIFHNGNKSTTAINPVADYQRPKTKIQAYLPTSAALPTSLSDLDSTTIDTNTGTPVKTNNNNNNNNNTTSTSTNNNNTNNNTNSNTSSTTTLSTSPSQSPLSKQSKIVSLLQLQQLYSEIMGFFVIEESIIRTGARLLTRTELESLWERGVLRLKIILQEFIFSITTIQDFLLVKEYTFIFLKTMESYRFNCNTLYEFLAQQLTTFKDLCLQTFVVEMNKLKTIDRFEPLTIYTLDDYINLVVATGLVPPGSTNDIQSTRSNKNTSNESSTTNSQSTTLSPQSLGAANTISAPLNNVMNDIQDGNGVVLVRNFPVTMPFSISIPLLAILLRTFIAYLFEYCVGLIQPSGSLSQSITTATSLLIKDFVIEFLSQHKGGSQFESIKKSGSNNNNNNNNNNNMNNKGNSPKSKEQLQKEKELLLNSTSVPLAVQGRMNAFYVTILAESLIKVINIHIEQRIGDNSITTHLSCNSALDHTVQNYDRFIIDILKYKVDKISYIDEFPWGIKEYHFTPSDSMLDITTFLHTTLSCTIFLPARTRQEVCVNCYEHIAQSIIVALQLTIPVITQMGLYNFLHDIHEFESLSNTYQPSTYTKDVNDASLTGGIDKKSHLEGVKTTNTTNNNNAIMNETNSIFSAMQLSKQAQNLTPQLQQKRAIEIAIMTPTTSSSMLTISFQRLRQVCLLFVTNDFTSFLDPDIRSARYNLLDGIFLQKLCGKFKEIKGSETKPELLPLGVKYVKKTDVDVFEHKLKFLIELGQL